PGGADGVLQRPPAPGRAARRARAPARGRRGPRGDLLDGRRPRADLPDAPERGDARWPPAPQARDDRAHVGVRPGRPDDAHTRVAPLVAALAAAGPARPA